MIPKKSKIFFLFYSTALTFIFSFNSHAKLNNIRIEKVSGVSGLSVETIMQDTKGFLWIGTQDGLYRYDGNKFKHYKTELNDTNSISNIDVRSIYETSSGKLLIGSGNSELFEYDYDSDNFRKIKLPFRNPSSKISSITEDNSGNLWVGTLGNGLYKLDKNKNFLFYYEKDSTNNSRTINAKNIVSLYYDMDSDKLFIGTLGGINVYDIKSQRFSYIFSDSTNPNSLSSNYVSCIFRDSRKILWIGTTGGGLNKYNEINNTFQRYIYSPDSTNSISNNNIISICEDSQGYLWIATPSPLLNYFEFEKGKFSQLKLFSDSETGNTMTSLLKDKSNVLWIGTFWGGLQKIDREMKKIYNLVNKNFDLYNSRNEIYQILKDSDNNILCQTNEFKYYKVKSNNDEINTYNRIEEFQNIEVNMISMDVMGNSWISYSKNGIFSIIVAKNILKNCQYYNFKDFTKNSWLHQLNDRNNPNCIWLGFDRMGLMKFDRSKDKTIDTISIPQSLRNFSVYPLFMDSKNNLWLGGYENGLFKYDISENKVINFAFNPHDSESISNNNINSVTEDLNHNIWVGTENGLNKYRESSNNFIRFNQNNGISSDNVYGILVDDYNNLWFSTANGLNKYEDSSRTFKNFFETDGLQFSEFNSSAYFKSKDGIMYFGNYCITYFNPDEIKDNPYIPNIALTDFQILNYSVIPSPDNPFLKKNISVASDINLSYKENVFSFEFAALIYNNPSKNQYAYMMEGFDKDWVYCGTRRNVTYTNLDPGEYTFRVKGSNNDGIWNEEGTSIKITITPPWWKSWWFKSCGAALVLLTGGFGYKKRVSKLKKEKLAQEEYSRKLLSSQEDERKRIANELHDSIAHDILILKNDVITAMNSTKDEETKKALHKISDQSSETLNDVRNISYNLHPHQIEALGITKAIRSMIDKVSGSTRINFITDIDNIDKVFTQDNELHVYRIIQEAISNIIKYSDSSEAIVRISCNKDCVSILISDNGQGFDVDNVEKGSLGLSGISERVNILGGTWSIESERGEGTLLKISILVKP